MKKFISIQLTAAFLLLNFNLFAQHKVVNSNNSATTLVTNVKIIDGTGAATKKGAVRISADQILEVGDLKAIKNETIINGKGLVLAPGFIDAHSHHLSDLQKKSAGLSTANQGITTIVIGQDGGSYPMDSLEKDMKQIPVVANVASYTGHSSLREEVMGENDVLRKATQAEVDKMKNILAAELSKGALGLSTGLEYEQAFYSSRDEVLQLAQVAANANTRYISHIRSEDVTMADALDEIIQIGKITKMPVQISHIKLAKKSDWNTAPAILAQLEKARAEGVQITADVYPYTFWNSTLRVLFPARDYTNLASAQLAVTQLFDPTASYIVQYAPKPSYVGKTVTAIAKERNESEAQTLMSLVAIAANFKDKNPGYKGSIEAIAAKSMSESDVAKFIQWPFAVICSDGNGGGHPRGFGSFTRILGKYVREDKIMSLETAIYKMTGQTANYLGIKDRGIIEAGKKADLVLFNPETVIDHAVIGNSNALSTGIEMVWVNGQLIYKNQKATGLKPGVLIKR
jgi:N-acyl-D-aspartate/D-glutamate deacylase